MSRSLKVAPQYIGKVKLALKRSGFPNQKALAERVGVVRSTINNFLNGKPVDYTNFVEICEKLGLDWQAIAADIEDTPPIGNGQFPNTSQKLPEQGNDVNIDALVEEVRAKVKDTVQERCGTMRVLDMTQPIGLGDIFTDVKILNEIPGQRWIAYTELIQDFDPDSDHFDHFGLGRISGNRVPGLKAVEDYPKLMVLGKPGAGKTTFLKYLAIQCISGELQSNRVPIFITLRYFAEQSNYPSLIEYITNHIFLNSGVEITQITDLLKNGKAFILLDGLDEVREEDTYRVLNEIRDLSDKYRTNHFVITCRLAAREEKFEKFVEVVVADFNDQQIETFVNKWFKNKEPKSAQLFLQQLKLNQRIRELATNPLMLTLLCLVFGKTANLLSNRSELYKEGVNLLLTKWDAERMIKRDKVLTNRDKIYEGLSPQRRENLLRQIAFAPFERKEYFFRQRDVEGYIANYIRNLPEVQDDPKELELDSQAVLKSIEAQHGLLVERARGIYSYSHLTFQEYFTARKIVFFPEPQTSEEAFESLAKHITEKRWREVLLLAVGMLPLADRLLLLIKQQVDALLAKDEKLQKFLECVLKRQKSDSVQVSYKPAAIRSFYFDIDLDLDPNRTLGCFLDFAGTCVFTCASFLRRALKLDFSDALKTAFDLTPKLTNNHPPYFEVDLATIAFQRIRAIDYVLERDPEPKLRQKLEKLKAQVPDTSANEEILRTWWKEKGQTWDYEMKSVIVEYSPLAEDWQFSKFSNEQKELLKQYYDANLLLMQCMNGDCYVSREVRQEIENTLLLPIAEIERLKNKG
jgi:predicted NACHT family NTPase